MAITIPPNTVPIDTFKATDINLKILDNSNEQTAVLTYINPETQRTLTWHVQLLENDKTPLFLNDDIKNKLEIILTEILRLPDCQHIQKTLVSQTSGSQPLTIAKSKGTYHVSYGDNSQGLPLHSQKLEEVFGQAISYSKKKTGELWQKKEDPDGLFLSPQKTPKEQQALMKEQQALMDKAIGTLFGEGHKEASQATKQENSNSDLTGGASGNPIPNELEAFNKRLDERPPGNEYDLSTVLTGESQPSLVPELSPPIPAGQHESVLTPLTRQESELFNRNPISNPRPHSALRRGSFRGSKVQSSFFMPGQGSSIPFNSRPILMLRDEGNTALFPQPPKDPSPAEEDPERASPGTENTTNSHSERSLNFVGNLFAGVAVGVAVSILGAPVAAAIAGGTVLAISMPNR